jgi:hypothetical protein
MMLTSLSFISKQSGVLLQKSITKLHVFMHIIGKTSEEVHTCLTMMPNFVNNGKVEPSSRNTMRDAMRVKTVITAMGGKRKSFIQLTTRPNNVLRKNVDKEQIVLSFIHSRIEGIQAKNTKTI